MTKHYATESARLSDTSLESKDVWRTAIQIDDGSEWRLVQLRFRPFFFAHWVKIGVPATFATVTEDIELTNQNHVIVTGGTSVTLPEATEEREIWIKNASAVPVVVYPLSPALIDEQADWQIDPNSAFVFVSDGEDWYVY